MKSNQGFIPPHKQVYVMKKGIAIVMVLVVLLWIANLVIVPWVFPPVKDNGTTRPAAIEGPGIFGDMFGGLNALFTGLSLAGIAIALLAQADQQQRQSRESADIKAPG